MKLDDSGVWLTAAVVSVASLVLLVVLVLGLHFISVSGAMGETYQADSLFDGRMWSVDGFSRFLDEASVR
ncbi:MAG: hypothetical protein D6E12_09830 [Desulfovibrio sp.]|nr:MAG: hypothetical protein D6E12_09830 [Desulfovibrio sp.]